MYQKYAVISAFLGRLKDRFIDYSKSRTLEQRLEMASKIKGCSGVELIYPQDFSDDAPVKELLNQFHLDVAAVNLNVKSEEKWRFGSFTNPDKGIRREAIYSLKAAMDVAADLGCDLVTSAFLNDGADYPFETDYAKSFDWTVKGVAEAAGHRSDIRVALEYKASEPRVHCQINNAAKAAYMAQLTGCDNVGVNVDVGHALQAQEIPAESIAFLAQTGKLFYVHINDNYRNWDWDLVPGTVNLWDYIELLYYLKRAGYTGWITADVFPGRHDPIRIMEKSFEWMEFCRSCSDKLHEEAFAELLNTGDVFDRMERVRDLAGIGRLSY